MIPAEKSPRPCPFCGGDGLQVVRSTLYGMGEATGCEVCNVWLPDDQWNRRTEDAYKARIQGLLRQAVMWLREDHGDCSDISCGARLLIVAINAELDES